MEVGRNLKDEHRTSNVQHRILNGEKEGEKMGGNGIRSLDPASFCLQPNYAAAIDAEGGRTVEFLRSHAETVSDKLAGRKESVT